MDPIPLYLFLEETGDIKYIKDVKLKDNEDRTSYIHFDYDTNKMPNLFRRFQRDNDSR